MIEQIDISNFGSFKNFVWNTSVRNDKGDVQAFKKLNILYGRNYSGKTTLSRILRSLHTGKLPDKYETPSFSVVTDTGGIIDQAHIPLKDLHIRVYNKDYVNEHLGFLRDNNGEITPFAIIGSENKVIEQKITEKEKNLGDVEAKTGLRHKYALKYTAFTSKNDAKIKAEKEIKAKLKNKATQPPNGIKHNPIYKDPNYSTPKIEADIEKIKKGAVVIFKEKERKEREALLDEVALSDIEIKLKFQPSFKMLCKTTESLLSKKITPTQPIQELLDDALLQMWVKEGIPQHRDRRKSCGFCGQLLPQDIWKKLDEHFSKESTDLEKEIKAQRAAIEHERKLVDSIISVEAKDFYSTLHVFFDNSKKALQGEIAKYCSVLNTLNEALISREGNIFSYITIPELEDNTPDIIDKISAVNAIIELNNKKTESLAEDQKKARNELRLSEVAQFIQDIDLVGEETKVSDFQKEAGNLWKEVESVKSEILTLSREIEALRIQLKDEKKGAEKVNEYLNHYFGHKGLRLAALEDKETSAFKFQIFRGEDPAYNLSEGECSLVSFCYFVAKLEDTKSKGKDLIIFIDDPISSLDSNHIFFIYSLIDNFIAKPNKGADGKLIYHYEQLFISTHNLEFLKYLKKLKKPKGNHEQFIVVGKENGSTLELMPSYLKNYISEFNYLFGEIYTCTDPANAAIEHHCFYNFGNNLRKFLEAFLFFKYPFSVNDQGDYNRRIEMFFKDEPGTETLVQRLTNEFSHLGGGFDRSIQPIDHAEISKLAKFILKKIKDNDTDQFECLLESVNKPDPFLVP